MIVYRLDGDLHCPTILCDACGKQITGMGNVYWIAREGEATYRSLWFTHKSPCSGLDRAIEQKTGELVLFEELDVWLDQLKNNFHLRQEAS